MEPNEARRQLEGMYDHLIDRETIFLRIKVKNREAAQQIVDWMFSKDSKPMLAELQEIAWDKELVSKEEAEAIRTIQNAESG